MDGRGGCCIARYGGGGAAYDMSKIDRIMLRFRPIAPKPTASGAVSAGSKASEDDSRYVKTGRGRRRRRMRRSSTSKDNNKSSSSSGSDDNASGGKRCRKRKATAPLENLSAKGRVQDNTVVTLPLLPEAPDLRKGQKMPVWLSFDGSNTSMVNGKEVDEYYGYPAVRGSTGLCDGQVGMWTRKQRVVVGSWVMVECLTDTWVEEEEGIMLGCTDEEKIRILEEDACPGLISDCWNRVWWTNKAYRKMAGQGSRGGRREPNTTSFGVVVEDEEQDPEVVVWLVMKEKVPATCQSFTCKVRVQSTWNQQLGIQKGSSSTATLPCDVWRMSNGGFAWRLDVNAALSLGR